jgi:hypothetical protein
MGALLVFVGQVTENLLYRPPSLKRMHAVRADGDSTGSCAQYAGENAHERGLAGAVRAE